MDQEGRTNVRAHADHPDVRTIEGYLALGNELFEACGAWFIRNLDTPTRFDANTIGLIRDASQMDALLARADVEYAHLAYRQFHLDPLTPPEVEARLTLAGFARWTPHLIMVLEGDLSAEPRPFPIREALNESDWQAYKHLQELDQMEYHERLQRPPAPDNGEYLAYVRAKCPPASTWLAYVGDVPCSYVTSWPGANGVGQIEDLFTHNQYRHRGLATALIAHCVGDLRAQGADAIVIIADPTDTPMQMYSALGFRPLFIARSQYL